MARHGFVSKVHQKKPRHCDMPAPTRRGNASKSVIRSRLEYVFSYQIIKRAEMKIGMANLVYTIRRLIQASKLSSSILLSPARAGRVHPRQRELSHQRCLAGDGQQSSST
ncbi:hypothetical protein NKH36_12575 [Mesorhizobium sp. M1312]|uniref:hypothetical protein n=1 Tax=unclassified Mesorhizobium TaxID=325217 RepID=UPI00333966C6